MLHAHEGDAAPRRSTCLPAALQATCRHRVENWSRIRKVRLAATVQKQQAVSRNRTRNVRLLCKKASGQCERTKRAGGDRLEKCAEGVRHQISAAVQEFEENYRLGILSSQMVGSPAQPEAPRVAIRRLACADCCQAPLLANDRSWPEASFANGLAEGNGSWILLRVGRFFVPFRQANRHLFLRPRQPPLRHIGGPLGGQARGFDRLCFHLFRARQALARQCRSLAGRR